MFGSLEEFSSQGSDQTANFNEFSTLCSLVMEFIAVGLFSGSEGQKDLYVEGDSYQMLA